MSDVLILDSGADKIKIGKGFYYDVIKNDSSYFHSIHLDCLWCQDLSRDESYDMTHI